MNKLMIITFALLISLSSFAGDSFDKLYSKYSGDEEITSVNLSKSLISIMSNFIGDDDVAAQELLNNVESLKLLISEKSDSKLSADAHAFVKSGKYEDLVKVNDGGNKVRIMVQENGDIIKDVVALVESEDEFIIINLTGNINPKEVGKVLKTLDIKVEGLEMY